MTVAVETSGAERVVAVGSLLERLIVAARCDDGLVIADAAADVLDAFARLLAELTLAYEFITDTPKGVQH